MVSLDNETRSNEEAFLIIKIDLIEFAIPITQLDKVGEFDNEFLDKMESEFRLGNYREKNELIPIINLKKYLQCPVENFHQTPQSRILFLRYSDETIEIFDTKSVGIGVDAIIGLYRGVAIERIRKTKSFATKELRCFQINSSVQVNSKIYPILDLIKVLDLI
ncbi:MAG: chemotaxis protein CheW [Promethearchaeota archaeon]